MMGLYTNKFIKKVNIKLTNKINLFNAESIPDMYDVVTQLEKIMEMEPLTYDLPCACTIHVSDVEDMRVDWPLTAGKRKHSRRRRRRTRRR